MSPESRVLQEPRRKRLQRLDAAKICKRLFYLEQALLIAAAGWIPALERLDGKKALARLIWQNSLTADALRARVFELRYPSRLLEEGDDAALIAVYRSAKHAPSAPAFLRALAALLVPLRAAYEEYVSSTDATADGPTLRFLELAIREKEEQARVLDSVVAAEAELSPEQAEAGELWLTGLLAEVERLGSVQLVAPTVQEPVPEVAPHGRRFELAQRPARDARYFSCSFYWPDILDAVFPYGEAAALQLRSAVSHLNEVWAVETAGAIIEGLSEELGFEFVRDAARWLFDESRHMWMGAERLDRWGFEPNAIPLGDYIYLACAGQDPIYRIGMLAYFETKNIGKKRDRAEAFADMGDRTSERHMEFDWADETIHAGYGRRWLKRLLEIRGSNGDEYPQILERCQELVEQRVAAATEDEKRAINACAEQLIAQAIDRARLQAEDVRG